MNQRNAIVLIFTALFVRELWILLPADPVLFDPFPFADVQISLQSYFYFACFYCSMMIFAYAFRQVMPEYDLVLTVWFFLQVIEFGDYFLTYNSPWFYVRELGVSITLVKFAVLSILIIHTWTRR